MAAFQYGDKVIAKMGSVHSGAWREDERQHTQAETRAFPAWVKEELRMVKLWNRLCRGCADSILNVCKIRQDKSPEQCSA